MSYLYVEKERDAPVFVLLHGTGGDEHSLVQLGEYLNPAASLLGLRGRVKEGGANRFFRRFAEGDFDLDDLARQTAYLKAELVRLAEIHDLQLSQMILLGYSNGANIGGHLLLTEETPITQGLFFHPMLLQAQTHVPLTVEKRVWLSYGEADPLVTREDFSALEAAYAQRGIAVTSFESDRGHAIADAELQAAKIWLAKGAV